MTFDEVQILLKRIDAISIMTDEERKYLFETAESFYYDIGRAFTCPPYLVVEVGCSHGGTTILLAMAAGHCIVVDNGQSGQMEIFYRNLKAAQIDHLVTKHIEDSEVAAHRFQDCSCGMVVIDGGHEGEKPYRDLLAWAPKVRPGGYLLVDDVADTYPDVTKAILRFLCEQADFEYVTSFVHPQWTGQVKLASFRKRSR